MTSHPVTHGVLDEVGTRPSSFERTSEGARKDIEPTLSDGSSDEFANIRPFYKTTERLTNDLKVCCSILSLGCSAFKAI